MIHLGTWPPSFLTMHLNRVATDFQNEFSMQFAEKTYLFHALHAFHAFHAAVATLLQGTSVNITDLVTCPS